MVSSFASKIGHVCLGIFLWGQALVVAPKTMLAPVTIMFIRIVRIQGNDPYHDDRNGIGQPQGIAPTID